VPDPYELDDEGRPVAEKRDEEEVDRAEKAEEAAAEPTVDAEAAAETEPAGESETSADAELIAGTEPSAENGLVAGTEPVAESGPAADPTAQAASMRRQIETTLRFMRLQTAVGVIVILGLIAFMSNIRGVLVLVLIIFTFSSLGAYWWLRRNLNARLGGPGGGRQS
jgi:hypothetical protein